MGLTRVREVFDGTIGAGATHTFDITVDSTETLALVFEMSNATAAGDISTVTAKIYNGDMPRGVVNNLTIPAATTIGPTLVGPVTQRIVRYDVAPYVELQVSMLSAGGTSRNLKIWAYTYG